MWYLEFRNNHEYGVNCGKGERFTINDSTPKISTVLRRSVCNIEDIYKDHAISQISFLKIGMG